MVLQVDWVGLERWSVDLALREPEMMALLEVMNAIKLDEFRCAARSPAEHIKLWENLSIETMGPAPYRELLVPLYRDILDLLDRSGKKLHVHYDGRLQVIAGEVNHLGIYGIDSLTEAPEGDMTVADARRALPEKFLWIHPNLGWYQMPEAELSSRIRRVIENAGPRRFYLEMSEEVPADWHRTVPAVLRALER
jgi:hypothetical protein